MSVLDGRTGFLLGAINNYCETGSFQLIGEKELLGRFPPQAGVDGECLRAMLNYLEEHGYIEVDYAEEGEYCLRPLPEGRMYFERVNRERREARSRRFEAVLLSVAGGFSGGFLGSLLAWLIAFRG